MDIGKDMKFFKHIIGETDETGDQRCLICGESIWDFAGVPSGRPAGEVYVSEDKWPTIFTRNLKEGDTSENCKNH